MADDPKSKLFGRLELVASGRDIGAQDERVAIIAMINRVIADKRLDWSMDQLAAITFLLAKVQMRGREDDE